MDNKTIETISYLARLEIDHLDKEKIVKDLDNIIDFIGQLQEINTEKVDPLSNPLEITAKTRQDTVNSDNNKETFLKNAPNSDDDFFLVPKVVEWKLISKQSLTSGNSLKKKKSPQKNY